MATITVNHQASNKPDNAGHPRRFSAAEVRRSATAARAICHAVAIAAAAQLDGAVAFEDVEASRWQPSIDEACELLYVVRKQLIDTAGAPTGCDWWTPINLLEALGSAMWHRRAGPLADPLEHAEVAALLCVAIESLDVLLQCPELESESTTSAIHA
jgi:hypothetical protein